MSLASDLLGVTEDTFAMIKSATSGILTTTGIAGIDLIDDLMSWVPVDTPFFNSVPRGQGKGATAVFWETLVNINNQQPDGGVRADYAAPHHRIQNQYTYSPYAVVGAGGTVSWDAIAQATRLRRRAGRRHLADDQPAADLPRDPPAQRPAASRCPRPRCRRSPRRPRVAPSLPRPTCTSSGGRLRCELVPRRLRPGLGRGTIETGSGSTQLGRPRQ